MRGILNQTALAGVLWLVTAAPLAAHPNDPKAGDVMPPYAGPGYRAGQEAEGPAFPANNVTLLSWMTLGEFGPGQTAANDIWGYTSPAGGEYAIIGLSNGTGFVEITNPADPQLIAVIPAANNIWRDMKTYGHYAYIVTESALTGGIQVVDLSGIDSGVAELVNTVETGGTLKTHNVALDEASGYLYRCGGGQNGLRIYDLNQDAANPAFVAEWTDRYVHDAQVVTYTVGPNAGRQIAFCCAGFNGGGTQTGLTILDVTDKSDIIELAHTEYPMNAYSHQGWLSADRKLFYLGDEADEGEFGINSTTHVIDVTDLENPTPVTSFTNESTAITHNLFTVGNLIYAANYRSGVRIFDATDPLAPVEVGFFDTFPEDDAVTFNGLWSNYPFFASGTIIGSDREKGLFVWQSALTPVFPGDLDGDGIVGVLDFLAVLEAWGPCVDCLNCPADLDGDCTVGIIDLLILLASWD